MHKDYFEFIPTHKLFLAANHLPQIRSQDYGIWRRFKMMPFTVLIPENKRDPDFKMMVARLYNAGVKAKSLTEQFGVARTTMKCWGDALRRSDPKELVRVFAGRGRRPKLTVEIRAFVRVRFQDVYSRTHYNYSAIIREEIEEIFGVELCAETLRPLFKQLKEVSEGSRSGQGVTHGLRPLP